MFKFKKVIIPALLAIAFASNASALNYKGKFKKKSYKISGAWALLEIEGHQVISFHDNFKTENGSDLKLVLSKKSIKRLDKNPEFKAPISLGLIKSTSGDQHYIVPKSVNLEDYKSVLIHSEANNVLWGGFDIPQDNSFDDDNDRDTSDVFDDSSFDDSADSFGS